MSITLASTLALSIPTKNTELKATFIILPYNYLALPFPSYLYAYRSLCLYVVQSLCKRGEVESRSRNGRDSTRTPHVQKILQVLIP